MPTIADLRWATVLEYRQVPTGKFIINRAGRRVPVTEGVEYVQTAAAGRMTLEEWNGKMEEAVAAEGKKELLDQIIAHCRAHCAWLKSSRDVVRNYAMQCLSDEAYKAWGQFEGRKRNETQGTV